MRVTGLVWTIEMRYRKSIYEIPFRAVPLQQFEYRDSGCLLSVQNIFLSCVCERRFAYLFPAVICPHAKDPSDIISNKAHRHK